MKNVPGTKLFELLCFIQSVADDVTAEFYLNGDDVPFYKVAGYEFFSDNFTEKLHPYFDYTAEMIIYSGSISIFISK